MHAVFIVPIPRRSRSGEGDAGVAAAENGTLLGATSPLESPHDKSDTPNAVADVGPVAHQDDMPTTTTTTNTSGHGGDH